MLGYHKAGKTSCLFIGHLIKRDFKAQEGTFRIFFPCQGFWFCLFTTNKIENVQWMTLTFTQKYKQIYTNLIQIYIGKNSFSFKNLFYFFYLVLKFCKKYPINLINLLTDLTDNLLNPALWPLTATVLNKVSVCGGSIISVWSALDPLENQPLHKLCLSNVLPATENSESSGRFIMWLTVYITKWHIITIYHFWEEKGFLWFHINDLV